MGEDGTANLIATRYPVYNATDNILAQKTEPFYLYNKLTDIRLQ